MGMRGKTVDDKNTSSSIKDLEARLAGERDIRPTRGEFRQPSEQETDPTGFVGVSAEYANAANHTEKPLRAEGGAQGLVEEIALDGAGAKIQSPASVANLTKTGLVSLPGDPREIPSSLVHTSMVNTAVTPESEDTSSEVGAASDLEQAPPVASAPTPETAPPPVPVTSPTPPAAPSINSPSTPTLTNP